MDVAQQHENKNHNHNAIKIAHYIHTLAIYIVPVQLMFTSALGLQLQELLESQESRSKCSIDVLRPAMSRATVPPAPDCDDPGLLLLLLLLKEPTTGDTVDPLSGTVAFVEDVVE